MLQTNNNACPLWGKYKPVNLRFDERSSIIHHQSLNRQMKGNYMASLSYAFCCMSGMKIRK
jgi:hypothetical protein